MTTKAIIGLIIVIAIIGVGIWLWKAPASPSAPESVPTVSSISTPTDTATPTPSSAEATAGEASSTVASAPTSAPAPKGKVISTKTINGMKIEITKEGTGTPIASGQTAVMLYAGKLTDGSVFDSTDKHGGTPFSFSLGAGQVIKGWDQGIVGMKVGEQRTLTIPPELGYGANGYPPIIPQNATLVFDVTLVGIK